MKKHPVYYKFSILVIFALGLVSCQGQGPKETTGTFIGGAAGALLGSQVGKGDGRLVGVAIGTLIGSQVGGAVGRSMDEQDRQLAKQSAQRALETQPDNKAVTWHNPNNNHRGSFKVTGTDEDLGDNKVCRDYVQTVSIDGQQQQVYGRACRDVRDPKAQWMVVK